MMNLVYWFLLSEIVLICIIVFLVYKLWSLEAALKKVNFSKRSENVRHGKAWEQFMPFSPAFPYDAGKFRFLGTPVDGLVFDDDEIVFVEFKTGSSSLNEKQKAVKNLIENKKVKWLELRF